MKSHGEADLASNILKSVSASQVVSTTLRADERVIARVTDGIYRRPIAALRELISNSYDADATYVSITTDAPRFGSIEVQDDGVGMSPQVLARLVHHIGGSAKRSSVGSNLGLADPADFTRSPGGRKLIGKIGIGLFSVSQLTQKFDIITKTKGDAFRTVASVVLRTYSDEGGVEGSDGGLEFEAGRVNIWREPATDLDQHGTSIHLTALRPQARRALQSREMWDAVLQARLAETDESEASVSPPRFHVGCVDESGLFRMSRGAVETSLPWTVGSEPTRAFREMVDAVWRASETGPAGAVSLEKLFDEYLRTVWQLSLSIPAPYVDTSPFALSMGDVHAAFKLSNDRDGSATRLTGSERAGIGELAGIELREIPQNRFRVLVDGLELSRPIRTVNLPRSRAAIDGPLLFLGECDERFRDVVPEFSGGQLKFKAYLLWTPKVVPREHQGVLVRIHGASGTGFDSTFMQYRVAELTRLRQIVCEVFVTEGLDSALNIDREAFNQSHPHAVFLARWIHSALRQLASAQKKLAADIRAAARRNVTETRESGLRSVVKSVWESEKGADIGPPPDVLVGVGARDSAAGSGLYLDVGDPDLRAADSNALDTPRLIQEKLKAISQLLDAFHLLDDLSDRQRRRLFTALLRILTVDAD